MKEDKTLKRIVGLLLPTVLVLATLLSFTAASFSYALLGDLDMDGALSTMDARTMLRYAVGGRSFTAVERMLADCNGDGRVDTLDARYVLKATVFDLPLSTIVTTTTTTTVVTTTTTKTSLDDDGYYDEIVKP